MHHSFDIRLATQYGIDAAILIHHFQHWIGINKKMGKNLYDGKTWTYQTQKYMVANFPYFKNRQHIIRVIDKLVEVGVLVKGNFNKTSFDRTVWYAFSDENKWIAGMDFDPTLQEDDNALYENGQCIVRKCTIDCSEPDNGKYESGQPIPDTKKTYTKEKIQIRPPSAPPAEAVDMANLLLNSIKKFKPDIKPPNIQSWAKDIERLMKIDGVSEERMKKVIDWLPSSDFWRKNILSAEKLRLQFDRLEIEIKSNIAKDRIKINREWAIAINNEGSESLEGFGFNDKGCWNSKNGKDVSFDLPHEQFKEVFKKIFGGGRC